MTKRNVDTLAWGILFGVMLGVMPTTRAVAQCVDGWTAAGLTGAWVTGVAAFDDGSGLRLFASGTGLKVAGGGPALGDYAMWDGAQWVKAGNTPLTEGRLHTVTLNGSPGLYTAMSGPSPGVAKWDADAKTWTPLGTSGSAFSVVAFDDSAGETLYMSGFNSVRRYTGLGWLTIGFTGAAYGPSALAVHDDGSGPALYHGGFFTGVSGVPAKGIAKWDGVAWAEVGGGVTGKVSPWLPPGVTSLAVFQGKLHACGLFTHAGGDYVEGIAVWDGKAWSAVGGPPTPDRFIWKLRVIDDGRGTALYAVGQFATIGGVPANNIGRWDGQAWSAIGNGIAAADADVWDVAYFSNAADSALFACGNFASPGNSNAANGLARYWCVCADLTGDGFVGQDDLAELLAAFGASSAGDIDKDGDTDQADLGALLQQYGTACE